MKSNVIYLKYKASLLDPCMTRDIDLALLRAFVAVVESGGVTSAARVLNRSQAAVSLQIKRLEELFGTELFQRERKRLSLAPAGERLLGTARRLIALNDETWGAMTTPQFEGEVRLGVPPDIVTSLIPPVLQRFNLAWPRINVSLVCRASTLLLEDFAKGVIDITLTTEIGRGTSSETLLSDRLVWVGARGGTTHLQRPLPVSLGAKHCRFRPVVIQALQASEIDWRTVSEDCNMEPVYATLKAGLAVAPLLRISVPEYLEILGADAGLPALPDFMVNLYVPTAASSVTDELARYIRQHFAVAYRPSRDLSAPNQPRYVRAGVIAAGRHPRGRTRTTRRSAAD
jgi:DNA-binding transcriptional LysR family regulator